PGGDVGTPGVEALRAIEREDRDTTVRGLVQHRVFGVGSTVAAGHLPAAPPHARLPDAVGFYTHTVYLSVPHSTTAVAPVRTPAKQPISSRSSAAEAALGGADCEVC